ncbi:hypothetical protein SAMN05878276_2845 [Aquipseudomonas alcaligenes]|jgi:hypothetical protein|uniref:hypothetical protein n=1 Tax=Aquipseudomonas alcaligenes TaxID=43263 RepID=UPI000953FC60|nr:hypothetical protein [Pseudomonas alcaligenes]SIS17164.1 hypothetical protein SAMN05878276_2845 [Pseudomonas alcaligenes]
MQLSPPRALLLFLLLALINGPALAGKGQVAGGGIASTIECNQNIARYLELDEQRRQRSDTPLCREAFRLSRRFLLA